MGHKIDPVIVNGNIKGSCPRCEAPYWGIFHIDDSAMSNTAKVSIEMVCQICEHKGVYFYQWPDELPKVTLRHWSNGRALGEKRRKKRKKNADGVLKGQIAFQFDPKSVPN